MLAGLYETILPGFPGIISMKLVFVLAIVLYSTAVLAQSYNLTPSAPKTGRLYCKHFPTYQDAVAFCLDRYGTTKGCGGLDGDNDGLPCECNKGGRKADERACVNWRKKNQ